MKNIKLNPVTLYLSWIGLCFIFWLLVPVLSANSDASAQVPFVLGTYTLMALICGIFLISLLNMLLFKEWIKKFWVINGTITIAAGSVIAYFFIKMLTL